MQILGQHWHWALYLAHIDAIELVCITMEMMGMSTTSSPLLAGMVYP